MGGVGRHLQQPGATQATAGPVGFYKREYLSGANKICFYDRMGSEVVITIPATSLCAISIP